MWVLCVSYVHMPSPNKQTMQTRSLEEKTTGHKDSLVRVQLAQVGIFERSRQSGVCQDRITTKLEMLHFFFAIRKEKHACHSEILRQTKETQSNMAEKANIMDFHLHANFANDELI